MFLRIFCKFRAALCWMVALFIVSTFFDVLRARVIVGRMVVRAVICTKLSAASFTDHLPWSLTSHPLGHYDGPTHQPTDQPTNQPTDQTANGMRVEREVTLPITLGMCPIHFLMRMLVCKYANSLAAALGAEVNPSHFSDLLSFSSIVVRGKGNTYINMYVLEI